MDAEGGIIRKKRDALQNLSGVARSYVYTVAVLTTTVLFSLVRLRLNNDHNYYPPVYYTDLLLIRLRFIYTALVLQAPQAQLLSPPSPLYEIRNAGVHIELCKPARWCGSLFLPM